MDILKNANWTRFTALMIIFFLACLGNTWADDTAARALLASSYEPSQTYAAMDNLITQLTDSLASCNDNHLIYRISYRIGILQFKTSQYDQAANSFSQLCIDSQCPLDIRIASLNMVGQIHRLNGHDQAAINTFQQLLELANEHMNSENIPQDVLLQMCSSAILSQAEILSARMEYTESLTCYETLLEFVQHNNIVTHTNLSIPSIYERISQLHFLLGDWPRYVETTEHLISDYPNYENTPLIATEMAFANFAHANSLDIDHSKGPWDIPQQVIAQAGNIQNTDQLSTLLETLAQIYNRYQANSASNLILYHQAWLLDAIEQPDETLATWAQLHQNAIGESSTDHLENAGYLATMLEYAKIQYAIVLGENANYLEALEVLTTLDDHPEESHLGQLAISVDRSLRTLKREVPSENHEQSSSQQCIITPN